MLGISAPPAQAVPLATSSLTCAREKKMGHLEVSFQVFSSHGGGLLSPSVNAAPGAVQEPRLPAPFPWPLPVPGSL